MRTDRRIIKAYLGDYGNWIDNPIAAIGYPQEVKLAINIYETFDEPDIRKVYRDVTGEDFPLEADENYLDKEREYREANYTKSTTPKPKRRPLFPWYDIHTQMNELHKITLQLEDRHQVIMLAIFKDGHKNQKIADTLRISLSTLEDNIGELYEQVGAAIRVSKHYETLFYELYHHDKKSRKPFFAPRKRKRKRALSIPSNIKPNFSNTLSLKQ